MRIFATSPEATFDYSITWPRARLLGVAIAGSDWASTPPGLAIEPHEDAPDRTGARIAGGEPGERYRIVHRVTLADDRTLTRAIEIEAAR